MHSRWRKIASKGALPSTTCTQEPRISFSFIFSISLAYTVRKDASKVSLMTLVWAGIGAALQHLHIPWRACVLLKPLTPLTGLSLKWGGLFLPFFPSQKSEAEQEREMLRLTQEPFQGLNTKSPLLGSAAQSFLWGELRFWGKTKAGRPLLLPGFVVWGCNVFPMISASISDARAAPIDGSKLQCDLLSPV